MALVHGIVAILDPLLREKMQKAQDVIEYQLEMIEDTDSQTDTLVAPLEFGHPSLPATTRTRLTEDEVRAYKKLKQCVEALHGARTRLLGEHEVFTTERKNIVNHMKKRLATLEGYQKRMKTITEMIDVSADLDPRIQSFCTELIRIDKEIRAPTPPPTPPESREGEEASGGGGEEEREGDSDSSASSSSGSDSEWDKRRYSKEELKEILDYGIEQHPQPIDWSTLMKTNIAKGRSKSAITSCWHRLKIKHGIQDGVKFVPKKKLPRGPKARYTVEQKKTIFYYALKQHPKIINWAELQKMEMMGGRSVSAMTNCWKKLKAKYGIKNGFSYACTEGWFNE